MPLNIPYWTLVLASQNIRLGWKEWKEGHPQKNVADFKKTGQTGAYGGALSRAGLDTESKNVKMYVDLAVKDDK